MVLVLCLLLLFVSGITTVGSAEGFVRSPLPPAKEMVLALRRYIPAERLSFKRVPPHILLSPECASFGTSCSQEYINFLEDTARDEIGDEAVDDIVAETMEVISRLGALRKVKQPLPVAPSHSRGNGADTATTSAPKKKLRRDADQEQGRNPDPREETMRIRVAVAQKRVDELLAAGADGTCWPERVQYYKALGVWVFRSTVIGIASQWDSVFRYLLPVSLGIAAVVWTMCPFDEPDGLDLRKASQRYPVALLMRVRVCCAVALGMYSLVYLLSIPRFLDNTPVSVALSWVIPGRLVTVGTIVTSAVYCGCACVQILCIITTSSLSNMEFMHGLATTTRVHEESNDLLGHDDGLPGTDHRQPRSVTARLDRETIDRDD